MDDYILVGENIFCKRYWVLSNSFDSVVNLNVDNDWSDNLLFLVENKNKYIIKYNDYLNHKTYIEMHCLPLYFNLYPILFDNEIDEKSILKQINAIQSLKEII